jgi:glyoxylase-like metal-dependent hydrolase (beta-lactamase superfamily II)
MGHRRSRLTPIVAAAAALVTSCSPSDAPEAREAGPDPSGVPESETYRLERVTDDVYATVVRDGISPSQFAASLIVIRSDHVLVVDSRHDDASAQELLDTIAALTDLPVGFVINTHWHGDHVQGNARFRAAYPNVRFVGGATTDEDIRTLGRQRLDDEIERVAGRIAAAEGRLESGTRDDGTPLTDEEKAALPGQRESATAYVEARRAIELVEPDITVERSLELSEASPAIEILRVGPAHTRGDVVVWIPERGVLALGDLIEDGFPYLGDGYPSGWADALDTAAEIEASVLLGAHGPVLRDRVAFETQRRFARLIADAAAAAEAGRTASDVVASGEFDEFLTHFTARMNQASEPERRERFHRFATEVLARAVAERTGESENE